MGWGGESAFGQAPALPPTPVASLQNKANFPLYQPALFIGFWAASSQTPLSVTVFGAQRGASGATAATAGVMASVLL